jgi:hypothetical protein
MTWMTSADPISPYQQQQVIGGLSAQLSRILQETNSGPTAVGLAPVPRVTDIGGGTGGQFKHIFLGATRILTMKMSRR